MTPLAATLAELELSSAPRRSKRVAAQKCLDTVKRDLFAAKMQAGSKTATVDPPATQQVLAANRDVDWKEEMVGMLREK